CFFFQAEDGIRDFHVTGVQTCALPISEIVVDNEKVSAETKAYKKIPQILSFTDEHGNDNMKQVIEANYRQVKADVVQIVKSEMERIKNDPDLQYLIQEG